MGILTNGPSAINGAIGEIITEHECRTLHGLLKLLRSRKHPGWLETFLENLTSHADADEKPDARAIGIKTVLSHLLDSVNETDMDKDVEAIMYQREGGSFTTLGSYEHEELLRYLGVQRSESWMGGFIDSECRAFDAQKKRTPEDVVRALVGTELEEFDCNVETTQKMLKLYPDLFTSDIERLAPKPAENPQAAVLTDSESLPISSKPEPPQYQLSMVEDGHVEDAANITHNEFQALKKHLTDMRARKSGRRKKAA